MPTELCDADAAGAEKAAFEIFLSTGGRLTLCGHHAGTVWDSLPERFTWMVMDENVIRIAFNEIMLAQWDASELAELDVVIRS